MEETLSNNPHLTDAELIEFSADVVDSMMANLYRAHIDRCSKCAAEVSQIRGYLAIWNSPTEIVRLESRIGRPAIMSDEEAKPWWTRLVDLISVAPLQIPLGANAAAAVADSEIIKFPVYENQAVSHGLTGLIQRRGQEYQIRITPSHQDKQEYRDRLVEVVLADLKSENVLLQRKIPIDRFVLLGTDLPIRTEKIAARLIA
jgi:hypothetical protein